MYIYIADNVPVQRTKELQDGTIIDLGPAGELVGVEILSVSSGWDPRVLSDRDELSDLDLQIMTEMVRASGRIWTTGSLESSAGRSSPASNASAVNHAGAFQTA